MVAASNPEILAPQRGDVEEGQVTQRLPHEIARSHPGLRPLANLSLRGSRLLPAVSSQPDVAATRRALKRKLLPHPRHEFGPGNPGGVVRAGLLLRVAAAFRAVTVTPVPACHGIALLANVPDRGAVTAFRSR
jgi:hypothetical protein